MKIYKKKLIARILEIDPRETEAHCKRLPIDILESWISRYAKYNPELDRWLFDLDALRNSN